ncbi:bifunctional [glutamine synthetase] adenylyltransferase/[glutamine synthetase]-adenylyl-L-tyrosine phosphorylase [Compostimonas suwonensis]|uniref:Bifunctional glutamine synthetase adenylyltransferase/adenylyl-removing enzyme n=1 Tax=Compostimonas suwonensis TaxID=1048394 RepID=A0A2M9BBH1_9MICO|nr:bifunctional [glutamine synthetase] adenylyltransferase/[glutamine synthetase]-adenylyl-L-tyrosine phosphorylase [Compostimonas suwonensis]PJJ55301.1 glutamate-ammonia-ligase adenylyltransferase [Compostimonas suwonensis]
MPRDQNTLTEFARLGFAELGEARGRLDEAVSLGGTEAARLLPAFANAADPDAALVGLLALLRLAPDEVRPFLADDERMPRLLRILGASTGLVDFFTRHPEELQAIAEPTAALPGVDELRADLLASVGAPDVSPEEPRPVSARGDESAWTALRVRYRRRLAQIASYDLSQADPATGLESVAGALADLAGAALEASLAVARSMVASGGAAAPGRFPVDEVAATKLAIIGMGKAGAGELNYVSDVDVIFVTEGDSRAVDISTRLAMVTMRGINEAGFEPPLWEVDPNLRPEGKEGALVRTLDSHLAYYDRWAKSWEFQALLKARPLAGDLELGERYVTALAPKVWSSASRESFVESVQRMRQRVTDHIPDDEVEYQLKLGPGGLRDVEFTVQLLQLVHGQSDELVRQRGTLPALNALAENGYIGRAEAIEFARDYRVLRLLEHRLQLSRLRRTHLMPRDEEGLRVLARASGLAPDAEHLTELWSSTKLRVRGLHERLFYRPLLSAVAALPTDEFNLSSAQAEARLAAIGFRDARGALAHIAALTSGVSRRATIQRHLLPVMLQWFADGADPDYGLLVFRRLSEDLGSTYWYLRMLRDSSGAAQRLTRVLSGSRYVGELLERIPESAAWLENDDELRPRTIESLRDEARAVLARHETPDAAASALRTARRREVLRLAFASVLGLCTVEELAAGLSAVTQVFLEAILETVRIARTATRDDGLEFAIIAMGRFGGQELGFGSDADVMYVIRSNGLDQDAASQAAKGVVAELNRLTEDGRLPLDLDLGLRPEGKNGPVVRSLDSYRAYYERWSLTWEAQALLRARGAAGDPALIADFEALANTVRYPEQVPENDVREIKRIKARVENERLPQGADPTRHLKLGRGSLSDVEWYVQLMQLQHAHEVPGLRTTSTLASLDALVEAGLLSEADAAQLRAAWLFASRARSALTLWTNRTSDVLPADRQQLEGVARLLEYPPGSATSLEEDYLAVTRRARRVFDRLFYGPR